MASPDDGNDEEDAPTLFKIEPRQLLLEGIIGQGTTATVYLARYKEEGREEETRVALKEIHTLQDDIDQATLQAVHRELCVLSQVDHPNILKFLGLVNQAEPLRLVLEYCRGGSLFQLLHNRYDIPLSWHQRMKMLQDTADGADYLHNFDPPIVHRDLKSLNLMLAESITGLEDVPDIKLADFGFARPSSDLMTQGVGTKHWMAPEVLQGTEYTEKADVFSFAMVAYEVVSRLVPFERHDPTSVAKFIGMGKRPRLDMPTAPDGLIHLIKTCWDQTPAARPTFEMIAADTKQITMGLKDVAIEL